MGQNTSDVYAKKKKSLSIISLNYSGILLSPFQFFSNQTQQMTQIQSELSNIFKALLKKKFPEFSENKKENKFKWSLGKIDQKMQRERYSPLYNKNAGLQKDHLLNQKEFKEKWELVFNENIEDFKVKEPGFQFKEEQKKQAVEFDFLCYKTIVTYVYNEFKYMQFDEVPNFKADKYKKFMELMFSKSFLDENKKLKKTFDAMKREKIDVVFAQEANDLLVKQLQKRQEYVVFASQNVDSIIIVRKQKFHKFYSNGKNPLDKLPDLKKEILWNNDTVVGFVDNLIFISGHLSSKKQKNGIQVYEMMESLKKLSQIYPMCHIIVGCDANSFLPDTYASYCKQKGIQCVCPHKLKNQIKKENATLVEKKQVNPCACFTPLNCQIFPNNKEMFTTSKQRTYLQPQVAKAEQTARVCRDHLIIFKADDLNIQQEKVCTILDKRQIDVQNIPCQQHPYDHYVVKAEVVINVVTHFGVNYDSD